MADITQGQVNIAVSKALAPLIHTDTTTGVKCEDGWAGVGEVLIVYPPLVNTIVLNKF